MEHGTLDTNTIDKEQYDKVLTLMALDLAYEATFGCRYIRQEMFDKLLVQSGVNLVDEEYMEERLKCLMEDLVKKLN